jgi:hypothetical protein
MIFENLKSDEEKQFYAWLLEAQGAGLVSNIEYEPGSYVLSEKVSMLVEKKLKTKSKFIEKHLLYPHVYTTDFEFIINHTPLLKHIIKTENKTKVYVDTKGTFLNRGAEQEFSMNRKWMFQKYGIYVNKIVPKDLFGNTWVPESWRMTPKTNKPVKSFLRFKTLLDYILETK